MINDTIKVALVTASYTPNFLTHTSYTGLTGQATGTGYTAGGKELASKTLTDNGFSELVYDAADLTWTNVTVAFRYLVLYDDTATGKPLIAAIDLVTTRTITAQDLTVVWQYSGLNPETGESETVPGILVMAY